METCALYAHRSRCTTCAYLHAETLANDVDAENRAAPNVTSISRLNCTISHTHTHSYASCTSDMRGSNIYTHTQRFPCPCIMYSTCVFVCVYARMFHELTLVHTLRVSHRAAYTVNTCHSRREDTLLPHRAVQHTFHLFNKLVCVHL